MFKSRSFTQTISYRVSGSSNQKSRALYVHCRFVLCPIAERLSFCRIGCSGVGKILKGDKNTTVMFHVGPLTSNLEKPAQGKVIIGSGSKHSVIFGLFFNILLVGDCTLKKKTIIINQTLGPESRDLHPCMKNRVKFSHLICGLAKGIDS